ncbi:MAG: sulfite exporter TauE/SafE family protein [Gemmatimonadetes bacterium]|nr:sulfite exporter TauE/SafE family protein [Gemmatimonadota bacterium]
MRMVEVGGDLDLFQEPLAALASEHQLRLTDGAGVPWPLHVTTFLAAMYGAYFGAGLGILILAFLIIMIPDDIQHSNALKGMLSLLINAVAVVYFAAFGPVEWAPAAVMAGGAIAGGYLGVGLARRLGAVWLRRVVIAYGLTVAAILLARMVT